MENSESRLPDPCSPVGSDLNDFSGELQLHTRLRDKLDELAHWRISPDSIRFPTEAPQLNGGCAAVSRALLISSSDLPDRVAKYDDRKKAVMDSNGRNGEPNRRVLKSEEDGDIRRNKTEIKRGNIKAKDKWRSRSRDLMTRLFGGRASSLLGFVNDWSSSACNLAQKTVAVKKMRISSDPWRVLRLTLREAGFLVELSHPNIVSLEGFVEDMSSNRIWLVFPWEEQGNLRDFVASADWEIPERISLINDVVRGVEYLHSRKPAILHGDLKSMNILINSEYRAVITDFGSARRLTAEGTGFHERRERTENTPQAGLLLEATFCASSKTMTLTGNKYTLRWAAPELLNGNTPGLWSDMWALGWVAYEVMTNSIPFQNVNDGMVIISVIQGDLPSITSDTRMLLIQALCSLMVDCWSIDPSQRPTASDCRKSIRWMPMITPNTTRTAETTASRLPSPGLLTEIANMHALQGDYLTASKFFTEALCIHTDRRGRANALHGLAEVHRLRNEYSQAITFYAEALEIYRDIGDRQRRAYALQGLGDVHRLQNEYSQAITYYHEVLQICSDIGGRQRRAYALQGLGDVHRIRNEYSQASTHYSEALRIRTDIGDRRGRAEALWGLAEVHRAQNKYSQAMALYTDALQIRTDIGDRQGRASALFGLAEVHRVQNTYSQAITFYAEVLQIQTDVGDKQGKANTLFGLADVHRAQHEHSQAVRFYHEALQICTEIGDRRGRAYILSGLADVHRARKDYNQAITFYSEALRIRTDIDHKRGRAYALWGLAEVHRLQNKPNQAMMFFSEALTVFTDIGDGYCGAFTLVGLGDVHRNQHDFMNAIHYYERAVKTFERIGNRKGAASALKRAAKARLLLERKEAAESFTETFEIE